MRLLVCTFLVFTFVAGSLPLPCAYVPSSIARLVWPTADAQSEIRTLLDEIMGKKHPQGIVKINGRIEATELDVSAKYPGRLVDITVVEGSEVKAGQVLGRVSSPEYEAQLERQNTTWSAPKRRSLRRDR